MTTVQKDKIARRKLSLLQLAQELGNVSKACKIVGYSRQQFYEIRRNFQPFGAEGRSINCPGRRVRIRTEPRTKWRRRFWIAAWNARRMDHSG